MTTSAADGPWCAIQPTDNLTIDANYTTQTETSGGSSRYTPAGSRGLQRRTHPAESRAAICATPT